MACEVYLWLSCSGFAGVCVVVVFLFGLRCFSVSSVGYSVWCAVYLLLVFVTSCGLLVLIVGWLCMFWCLLFDVLVAVMACIWWLVWLLIIYFAADYVVATCLLCCGFWVISVAVGLWLIVLRILVL